MIGSDPQILEILRRIQQIAPTNASVLLQGESGTSKTHIARMMSHRLSHHSDVLHSSKSIVLPFQKACSSRSCLVMSKELLYWCSSEQARTFPSRAQGYAIFRRNQRNFPVLTAQDAAGYSGPNLRMLGSDKTITVGARVISASNRNLREMLEWGTFRAGLYI